MRVGYFLGSVAAFMACSAARCTSSPWIEKRIAELRSVEAWLNMNLNMLKLSINGLELQRAALQAMKDATNPPEPKDK